MAEILTTKQFLNNGGALSSRAEQCTWGPTCSASVVYMIEPTSELVGPGLRPWCEDHAKIVAEHMGVELPEPEPEPDLWLLFVRAGAVASYARGWVAATDDDEDADVTDWSRGYDAALRSCADDMLRLVEKATPKDARR